MSALQLEASKRAANSIQTNQIRCWFNRELKYNLIPYPGVGTQFLTQVYADSPQIPGGILVSADFPLNLAGKPAASGHRARLTACYFHGFPYFLCLRICLGFSSRGLCLRPWRAFHPSSLACWVSLHLKLFSQLRLYLSGKKEIFKLLIRTTFKSKRYMTY